MLPPCASATCRATARPRPTPSGLPVTNGSNNRSAISLAGQVPNRATVNDCRSSSSDAIYNLQSAIDLDPTARPSGLDRVAQHVERTGARAGPRPQQHGPARQRLPAQVDPGVPALRTEQGDGLVDQRPSARRTRGAARRCDRGRGSASGGPPPGRAGAGPRPALLGSVWPALADRQLHGQAGAGDAVAELMRQAAADLAEQTQPFGLARECPGYWASRSAMSLTDRAQVAQLVVAARQRHGTEIAGRDQPGAPLQFLDAPAQPLRHPVAARATEASPPNAPRISDGRWPPTARRATAIPDKRCTAWPRRCAAAQGHSAKEVGRFPDGHAPIQVDRPAVGSLGSGAGSDTSADGNVVQRCPSLSTSR